MIGVAFISDRADKYLPGCIHSFVRFVYPSLSIDEMTVTVIDDRDHRLGMSGAVNAAWDWARAADVDYLLHVEEDFRFTADIDVHALADLLDEDPTLAQVVLKRQPWSPEEHRAGGIIECHPLDYTDLPGHVVHQRIFSLNPCLIPRRILDLGWPAGNEAEMTTNLVARGYRFAFLGHRSDPPRVEHVGAERGIGWRL